MEVRANNEKKKKGLLATIWESMTKTGGCCGSGGNCCGPADPTHTDKKAGEKKDDRGAGTRNES